MAEAVILACLGPAGGSVARMDYLVGATRMQLIRLRHLEPGTRVLATERIPSGPAHAAEGPDATQGLCGVDITEVMDRSFGDTDFPKCERCEALVAGRG